MNDEQLTKLKDPRWRLNHLYKIINKLGSIVTFKENTLQRIVNEHPAPLKMILKARQIGFSTSRILRMLDHTIWNRNQTTVIMAHEVDSITKLFRIVYRALKFMDPQIKPIIDKGGGSRHEYFFPEVNSRIYCDLESRSDTIHKLHVSEIGLMKNDDRVRATLDAVPITGEVTYESTPKGINHFYEMWNDPTRHEAKFFFPWYMHPEYKLDAPRDLTLTENEFDLMKKAKLLYKIDITPEQLEFRRWKIAQKGGGDRGLRAFLEEFPEDDQTCFLTSGNPAMDLILVKGMFDKAPEPIHQTDTLKIWERYDKNKFYACGADTSEGVGKDFSVGSMFEVGSRKQVAQIRGQWKPYDFACELNELCQDYVTGGRSHPLLAVERNNHGHAVLLQLSNENIGYQNLYFHKDERAGWLSDRVTRPIMVDTFIDGVENQTIVLNDRTTLAECLTLVDNDGKIEAAEGKHDDCVIASAIAVQMCINSDVLKIYQDIGSKILL